MITSSTSCLGWLLFSLNCCLFWVVVFLFSIFWMNSRWASDLSKRIFLLRLPAMWKTCIWLWSFSFFLSSFFFFLVFCLLFFLFCLSLFSFSLFFFFFFKSWSAMLTERQHTISHSFVLSCSTERQAKPVKGCVLLIVIATDGQNSSVSC